MSGQLKVLTRVILPNSKTAMLKCTVVRNGNVRIFFCFLMVEFIANLITYNGGDHPMLQILDSDGNCFNEIYNELEAGYIP